MTPDPKRLAVALDAIREAFGDDSDVSRWAANAQHVRNLMERARYAEGSDDGEAPRCVDCGAAPWEPHTRTQLLDSSGKPWRDCIVAAAWRALGDPRGAADIERAHEEALRTMPGRDLLSGAPVFATQSALERLALRASDTVFGPMTDHDYTDPFAPVIHMNQRVTLHHYASESEQAARERESEAEYYVGQATYTDARRTSDARGMEAVEDEARAIEADGRQMRRLEAAVGARPGDLVRRR